MIKPTMIELIFKILQRFRVVHLMFAITFFTSGLIINFFQCLLYFGLRPVSKYWYRKINYYLNYTFYSQLVCLAEWWSGSELTLYIDRATYDKFYGNEHGYLIMNHSYEIDWLIGWIFCDRSRVLGNCKAYAKKSIQYVPTLGWAWKFAESIFLERNFDKDKDIIGHQISKLLEYPDPMWLLLYAEGTRFTPEKLEASQKFSSDKHLPVLQHHLTPRTRGFIASIPFMRKKPIAIYDVQLVFKPSDPVKPVIKSMLFGEKCEGHMYVNRIPLDEVPEDDEGAAQWLRDLYYKKDQMTDSFIKTGDFFATSGVQRTDVFKLPRRYYSLVNTLFWAIVILVPMLYYLVNLLLSGSTVQCLVAIGIISLFFMLMQKTIGMSEISKSSSAYGATDSKKKQ